MQGEGQGEATCGPEIGPSRCILSATCVFKCVPPCITIHWQTGDADVDQVDANHWLGWHSNQRMADHATLFASFEPLPGLPHLTTQDEQKQGLKG
jgi:hypothetical protein